ncbi:MAG: hypothetical protein HOJ16_06575 [Candidatus Peribacter sp.]|nr:hypothetical protein [Candidatus Peribacter sp.]
MTCEEYIKRHGLELPVSKQEAVEDLLKLTSSEYLKLGRYWGKELTLWGDSDEIEQANAEQIESYKRMGEHDYKIMYKG